MTGFINDPDRFVIEACRGLVAAHPGLDLNEDPLFLYHAPRAGTVPVVSGGGSGHEPLHAGFVGAGMLSAACPGLVFTSPTVEQVVEAAARVGGPSGVLLVVKNYTGDVLTFELAAELLAERGVPTATVVVHDDVATSDVDGTPGRRGVAGTIVVEKILGAAAGSGLDLDGLAALGERVGAATRSIGVALTSCHLPGRDQPLFDLPDGQMEVGVGIHGEAGHHRESAAPASEIAEQLCAAAAADLAAPTGAQVLLITNGFGATPLAELYLLHQQLLTSLLARDIGVSRHLVGNFVTSLDMAGASMTVTTMDDELLRLWDAPVQTPALRW